MLPPNIASRPTAPLARAGGGETRFGACLLAKGVSTQSARRLMLIVGRRGATERTWTLPGETRAEVSQLYPSRVQSVGHSSSRAHKAPAVWVAAQHRFKADAASLSAIGGETCAKGSALEGETPHPPRGLSRGVGRRELAICKTGEEYGEY